MLTNDILGAGRGVGRYVGVVVVGLVVGTAEGEETGKVFGLIDGEASDGFCDWNWVDTRDGLKVGVLEGFVLGTTGIFELNNVEVIVGEFEGLKLESTEGELVGNNVVGEPDGLVEGDALGSVEGSVVGFDDEGPADGE